MADTNTVNLSVSSYNQIKSDNFKMNLFIDNILQMATLAEDHQSLDFSATDIENALKFCFYERYKKKLAVLKGQFTKYGTRTGGTTNETEIL